MYPGCMMYAFCCSSLLGFIVISAKIVHKQLDFSWRLDGSVRSFTHSLSIEDCWTECKDRTFCVSVNYHRQTKICEFNTGFADDNTGVSLSRTKGWVYYQNQENQKCNGDHGDGKETCPIKECVPIHIQNGFIQGKMLTVGSKATLSCNEGLMSSSGPHVTLVSQCKSDGKFNATIECFQVTCQEVAKSGYTASSTYKSFDSGSGQIVDIFCDFASEGNTGYTFLSKTTLSHVTSLSNHYDLSDHVIVRHYKTALNQQYSSSLSVLSLYRSQYPDVSVLLSEHPNFTSPSASDGQYLYLGFVPVTFGDHRGTQQGYACDGVDKEFYNCDGISSNYFALYENRNGLIQKNGCCQTGQNGIAINWKICAMTVHSSRNMDLEFFYDTYEIHMGGCGAYVQSNVQDVGGMAFGLPFDF